MPSITETMSADHRRCDTLLSEAEESISKSKWAVGGSQFNAFKAAMKRHFAIEEEALFPGLEKWAGQGMGPTQVMRTEHVQMRQLLLDMEASVSREEKDRYLGLSETLMIIMQQHNMKEENMLYPMVDREFGDQSTAVLREIEQWSID